jgi:hypothetical protein
MQLFCFGLPAAVILFTVLCVALVYSSNSIQLFIFPLFVLQFIACNHQVLAKVQQGSGENWDRLQTSSMMKMQQRILKKCTE